MTVPICPALPSPRSGASVEIWPPVYLGLMCARLRRYQRWTCLGSLMSTSSAWLHPLPAACAGSVAEMVVKPHQCDSQSPPNAPCLDSSGLRKQPAQLRSASRPCCLLARLWPCPHVHRLPAALRLRLRRLSVRDKVELKSQIKENSRDPHWDEQFRLLVYKPDEEARPPAGRMWAEWPHGSDAVMQQHSPALQPGALLSPAAAKPEGRLLCTGLAWLREGTPCWSVQLSVSALLLPLSKHCAMHPGAMR